MLMTNPLFSPLLLALPVISKESLFAVSLFPYLGFLWFLTRSQQMPRLALIGFYMTLVLSASPFQPASMPRLPTACRWPMSMPCMAAQNFF